MTGPELRELRQSLGLDQYAMAYLVGCRQHHISRWESGKVQMGDRWHAKFYFLKERAHQPEWQARIADAILATY